MPVTDPTAVRFSNEVVRPLADQYAQLYYQIIAARDQWLALGMAAKFPAGAGVVEDGSPADGRSSITADDALAFATRMNELAVDLEAGGKLKLNSLLKIAVHPTR